MSESRMTADYKPLIELIRLLPMKSKQWTKNERLKWLAALISIIDIIVTVGIED